MRRVISLILTLLLLPALAIAGELRIPIPKNTPMTPVQNLNREGVRLLNKGNVKKAKEFFYKAYLLDPNDPFTLNNLGYLAELDGDADRALRFYALAANSHTDAVIDEASSPGLKGLPVNEAFDRVRDSSVQANQANEQAIVLLERGHLSAANALLRSALQGMPHDPFLLNNLGFVMESEGDLESALRFYSAAASLHSKERIAVSPRPKWRGRPISEVAGQNASAISELIAKGEDTQASVARLNLRGVAALNDNRLDPARTFFLQAYRLDPQNAFTLNNIGYLSELTGDRESAEMYYQAAREGADANLRVTYSTRTDAEGRKLDDLAQDNQTDVNSVLHSVQEAKRRTGRPVRLIPRGPEASTEAEPTKAPPIGVKNPSLPPLPPPDAHPQTQPPPAVPPSPIPPGSVPNPDQHE